VTSGITPDDSFERRPLAVTAVLAGAALGLLLGPGLTGLLRERLHYLCSGGPPGTEAEGWVCPDGIGYVGAGFLPLGVAAFAVIGAVAFILGAREPRHVRPALVVLATIVVGVGLAGTWAAVTDPHEVPPGVTRLDFWIEAVLPAAIVVGCALVVACAALVTRDRIAAVLTSIAAAGILISTVVQPGLAISTMPALGLLVAAVLGVAPHRRSPRQE
jgi:MFS family permease